MLSRVLTALLVVSVGFVTSPAFAIDTWFRNTTGNREWDDPANWSNGVPGPVDSALLQTRANIPTNQVRTVDRVYLWNGPSLHGGRVRLNSLRGNGDVYSDVEARGNYLFLEGPDVRGVIGDGASGGDFGVVGSGELRNVNTYTGPTTVTNELTLWQTGAIPNTQSIAVQYGSLRLVSTTPLVQIAPTVDIQLRSGELSYLSAFAANPTVFRHLIVSTGHSTVRSDLGPSTVGFVGRALVVEHGATLGFDLTAFAPAAGLRLLEPPLLPQVLDPVMTPVVPYATERLPDGFIEHATYDYGLDSTDPSDDVGFRALTPAEQVINAFVPDANVRLQTSSSAGVLTGDRSIRSLKQQACVLDLRNGSRLTVSGNAWITDSPVIGTGVLVFPGDAFVSVTSGTATGIKDVDVRVEAQSLTKSGPGILSLNRANHFPGGVYVAQGTLIATAPGALGGGAVTLAGDTQLSVRASNAIAGLHVDAAIAQGDYLALRDVLITCDAPPGNPTAELTVAGPITGSGKLKQYSGRVVYTGSGSVQDMIWEVAFGEFRCDGAFMHAPDGSLEVQVTSTSTVSGHGTIGGNVVATGGTISPGPGTAALTIAALMLDRSFERSSRVHFDLNGTSPEDEHDQLRLLDSLSILNCELHVTFGYAAQQGDQFAVIDNLFAGPMAGTFLGLPQDAVFPASDYLLQISYIAGDGNDVVLTVVPEPGVALYALALVALRRRRRF